MNFQAVKQQGSDHGSVSVHGRRGSDTDKRQFGTCGVNAGNIGQGTGTHADEKFCFRLDGEKYFAHGGFIGQVEANIAYMTVGKDEA